MGLYDGLGGTQKEGSAYHLAQTLDLPVVLVLDARGMGRTMVALLAGILQYDRDHRIIGVILNRISEGFCRTMTPVIEKELGLPVLGCFRYRKSASGEPASGFENATGNGRSAQAGQSGCGKT